MFFIFVTFHSCFVLVCGPPVSVLWAQIQKLTQMYGARQRLLAQRSLRRHSRVCVLLVFFIDRFHAVEVQLCAGRVSRRGIVVTNLICEDSRCGRRRKSLGSGRVALGFLRARSWRAEGTKGRAAGRVRGNSVERGIMQILRKSK